MDLTPIPTGSDVTVQVSDGNGGTDMQAIAVTVTNSDEIAPTLLSLTATDPLTTNAGVVHYTATFSEAVTGVDASQFSLAATGVTGASITSVNEVAGSNGTQYTVAVSTGTGDGTVALAFTGADVRDLIGNPLAGGTFQSLPVVNNMTGHVVAGDLDGDGDQDVVSESLSGGLDIRLGNGDGTFGAPAVFAAGDALNGITIGDVNNDTFADIIASNWHADAGTVSILLGAGDGTFAAPITAAADVPYPSDSDLGDFNEDGKVDLVLKGSLLFGNGDGTFQAPVHLPTVNAFISSVADLNHDGHLDIVNSNYGFGVQVFLGNGNGTFNEVAGLAGSFGYWSLLADFNNDGNSDIALTRYDGTLNIALGNGDGTFQPETSITVDGNLYLVVQDADGDGNADILSSGVNVQLLRGNGDGTFQTPQLLGDGYTLTSADFNGDGRPDTALVDGAASTTTILINTPPTAVGPAYDVDRQAPTLLSLTATDPLTTNAGVVHYTATFSEAVTGVDASQFSLAATGVTGASITSVNEVAGSNGTQYTVAVNTGSGDGTVEIDFIGAGVQDLAGNLLPGGAFQLLQTFSDVSGHVTTADFNGDGDLDLVSESGTDTVSVRLGDGDGTFQAPVVYAVGDNPNGISVGDLNNDNIIDLAVSNYNSFGTVSVLLGIGDGTFQPRTVTPTQSGHPAASAIADVNGDSNPDLIVANSANRGGVSILLGNGDGTFDPFSVVPSNSDPVDIAVADINGDGIADFAFSNVPNGFSIQVYLGNGDGTFDAAADVPAAPHTYAVSLEDLNHDSKADLVFTDYDGGLSIALGNGDGTFAPSITHAIGSTSGDVKVADVNSDGEYDLLYTDFNSNLLAVLTGNGDGSFQSDDQFVTGGTGPGWAAVGDFTGDGRPDLAIANFASNSTSVLLNVPPTITGTAYTIDKNDAPTIASDGGGATASASIAENTTALTTITATDPDAGQTLSYSIIPVASGGGADAALFTIDAQTGALSFLTAPNFEAPTDAGADNIYDVTVQVSDGSGGIDTQAIAVSVQNVPGITLTSNAATITGTAEEDVLTGLGGANTLQGLGGNDVLTGGGGADTLVGGTGNDTLSGGTGNDTINGGAGNDTVNYTFGDGADAVNGGADLDRLNIIGTTAANTLDVIFNGTSLTNFEGGTLTNVEAVTADLLSGTDALTYAGTTAAIIVNLSTGTASGFLSIAGIENVTGGSGDDTFTGDAGANALTGGGGNDRFIATVGDGNDTLTGGGGTDTYDLSATTAGAILTLTTATNSQIGTDTLASIENFIGSQGNDTITAGSGVNVIDGQGGNDTITGGTGNDTLFGGAGDDIFGYTFGDGADTIDGGIDFDTLNIVGTTAADTLDVVFNGSSLTNFENGTVSNVEAITANLLGGTDTLNYAGTTANITVNLGTGAASGFLSIAGVENVTGGSGNDTLTGNGLVNVLNGGAGNDSLDGGLGNDTLAGGAGNDTYFANNGDTINEGSGTGSGTDSVLTNSNTFALAANVENLTFTGVGNFTGTGNGSNNIITGASGNDALSGAGGNDTLIGAGGNDTLSGGAAFDTFVFAAGFGADQIQDFDFNPAGGGQDFLDISAFGITTTTFASRVGLTDLGANILVTIDGDANQTIALVNAQQVGNITQNDFILAV